MHVANSSSSRRYTKLASGTILGCIVLLALIVGLFLFIGNALRDPQDVETRTDAIVALTGGNSRIDTAIGLLNAGFGKKLFISGVKPGSGNQDLKNASHQATDLFICCVVLGHKAANTIGNAVETAAWMADCNYHSLRLVTADYHMQRALLDFRLAMPDTVIIPHPVHPQVSFMRHSLLLVEEYGKYLATLPRYALHSLIAA